MREYWEYIRDQHISFFLGLTGGFICLLSAAIGAHIHDYWLQWWGSIAGAVIISSALTAVIIFYRHDKAVEYKEYENPHSCIWKPRCNIDQEITSA